MSAQDGPMITVLVTEENLEDVAEWCEGSLDLGPDDSVCVTARGMMALQGDVVAIVGGRPVRVTEAAALNHGRVCTDFLDFPTAWRIQNEGVTHVTPKCSTVQGDGAFLCDCGAVRTEWERRVAGQFPLLDAVIDATDPEVYAATAGQPPRTR